MKKLIISFLILHCTFFISQRGMTQGCLPEGITFTTQEQIDSFQTNYPGCTEIEGDLYISGYDIINLAGLSVLNSIAGDLSILTCIALSSLSGLENITSIGGDLSILSNNSLTSLSGLNNLTSIGGDLKFEYTETLTDLTGLDGLSSIGGILSFGTCNSLTSLSGLESLMSIGSQLYISGCNALTSLSGLDNLNTCFWLSISDNDALTSLAGLDNLTSIGDLWINDNDALTNLAGLDNLTSIASIWISNNEALNSLAGLNNFTSMDIWINDNDALTSLAGLDNLTTVGGRLWISDNDVLTSLAGLDNLTTVGDLWIIDNDVLTSLAELDDLDSIGGFLDIINNQLLSSCEAQALCEYLSNPAGPVNIYGNAEGCRNPGQVAAACRIDLSCLPYGNYYFHSQEDVDDFPSDYPDCSVLQGIVEISGSDITNLNGLNAVTSITGSLIVSGNTALINLSGLENVDTVAYFHINGNPVLSSLVGLQGLTSIGNLEITSNGSLMNLTGPENLNRVSRIYLCDNPILSSLTGLESLTTIREDLTIGYVTWGGCGNPALTSLTGLENVSFIGNLNIQGNETLTSLAGIDHLDPDSVGGLTISYNGSLSACSNPFVCDYLVNHGANIHDNAPGCNSVEEVEAECPVGMEESSVVIHQSSVIAYPNPTSGIVDFRLSMVDCRWVSLKIYNAQGQEVAMVLDGKWSGDQVVRWDAGVLPAGIYYYQLRAKGVGQVCAGKVVKY